MRAASIFGPASPSVPIRTDAVTWPRVTRWRSASRMSPSSRASPLGVLMLGLKNRWLTDRISTAMRLLPTVESPLPNPVMLFMRRDAISVYEKTLWLVPEVPSHSVEIRRSRHQVSRRLIVPRPAHVPHLPPHHRPSHPHPPHPP